MKPLHALHLGTAIGHLGTAIGLLTLAIAMTGCGGKDPFTPAQEAAAEKAACVIIESAAAPAGPIAEELVTIACNAAGAWLLAKLDAARDAGAPDAGPTAPQLQTMKVRRVDCVSAGLCAPKLVDAGGGG